jgi:Sel1 repeat-containing protein
MHWTSVRGAASHYAAVGATYIQTLRTGKTGPPANNVGASSAGTGPAVSNAGPVASNDKAGPDFIVEQPPAQQTSEGPSAGTTNEGSSPGVPKTRVETVAPESSLATTARNAPPISTTLNAEPHPNAELKAKAGAKAGSGDSTGQTPAVEPKRLAAGTRAESSKPAESKPSARQSPKPSPGQGEYQQALTTTNPDVARALLWRATALGNSDAQVRLADMYIYGQGVPQNCDQGLLLLRSAAQKANARARSRLGALYATGKCVSQDRVQAYRWLSLALNADQTSEWTEKNRQMVWRQMSPEERARAANATR